MTQEIPPTTLDIRLVAGWSVWLHQQDDPALRWKATATKGRDFRSGTGLDQEMTLKRLAQKCGFDWREAMRQFGL